MDCSQPSFTCQKLRQGWSLKVILPCFFISLLLWISIFQLRSLSLKRSYFERFIRQPGSSSLCSEWLELCKLPKNFVSITIPRDNALNVLVSSGNCFEHTVYIQKIILAVVSMLRCLFPLTLQVSLLHAFLHWNWMETTHLAPLHCLDPSLPLRGLGRRYL